MTPLDLEEPDQGGIGCDGELPTAVRAKADKENLRLMVRRRRSSTTVSLGFTGLLVTAPARKSGRPG